MLGTNSSWKEKITPRIFLIVVTFLAMILIVMGFYIANLNNKIEALFLAKPSFNLISSNDLTKSNFDIIFENYLKNKEDNSDKWMTVMTIISTIFAVFFVYTGFKIDSTKEKVDEASKNIIAIEKKINEDIYEYTTQLQYSMAFIVQKQYAKAIDALTVLRNEYFVLKDDRKINTCCFFLAHCYYERGITHIEDLKLKKEDLALAVEYINQAISDSSHPFKNEIINAFNALDQTI